MITYHETGSSNIGVFVWLFIFYCLEVLYPGTLSTFSGAWQYTINCFSRINHSIYQKLSTAWPIRHNCTHAYRQPHQTALTYHHKCCRWTPADIDKKRSRRHPHRFHLPSRDCYPHSYPCLRVRTNSQKQSVEYRILATMASNISESNKCPSQPRLDACKNLVKCT